MYCHTHHCHIQHCSCDSSYPTGQDNMTEEELIAFTQEMKQELKEYTVDLKDQIFSYIDVGLNPVEIANSINSLKEQDTYILRTLTKKIDELNNTSNLSIYSLRTRVTNLESNLNSLPFEGGVLSDTFVTVTEKGEGTITRTQRDKNSDSLSVKDFGAKGDGVTDDTLAIQAALDIGGVIYFPSGKYLIGAVEVKHNSTSIVGDRLGVRWIANEAGVMLSGIKSGESFGTTRSLMVSGITFVGDTSSTTYAFRSTNLVHSTFINCEFRGIKGTAIDFGYGWCNNFYFNKFNFVNYGITTSRASNNICNIVNNYFGGISEIAIGFSGGLNVNIHNNTFESIDSCAIVVSAINKLTIRDNYFEKNSKNGLQITLNTDTQSSFGVTELTVYTDIMLLASNSWDSFRSGSTYPCSAVTIAGNSFSAKDEFKASITVGGARGLNIENNHVHDTNIDTGGALGIQACFTRIYYWVSSGQTSNYHGINLKNNNLNKGTLPCDIPYINRLNTIGELTDVRIDTANNSNHYNIPALEHSPSSISVWSEGATLERSSYLINNSETVKITGHARGHFIINTNLPAYKHLVGKIIRISMTVMHVNNSATDTIAHSQLSHLDRSPLGGNRLTDKTLIVGSGEAKISTLSYLYLVQPGDTIKIQYFPILSSAYSDVEKLDLVTYFGDFKVTELGCVDSNAYLSSNIVATQAPLKGEWLAGTVIYNSSASSTSNVGWVCTKSSPNAVWSPFGTVE